MGAPLGNQNAAKAKRWEAAITRALEAYPLEPSQEGKTDFMIAIDKAAHKFVKKLMEDDNLGYFKEFGDRIDGKAAQAIIGDPEQPLSISFGWKQST